jgi:hypothetical protein
MADALKPLDHQGRARGIPTQKPPTTDASEAHQLGQYEFRLPSGRVVGVASFYMAWTYEKFLVGGRNEKTNRRLIEEAAHALVPMWGERPVHVVSPPSEVVGQGRLGPQIALPPLRYHAWLTSDPLNAARGGSELILVWFGDGSLAPFEYVDQLTQGLAWEELAKDWDY